MKKIFLFSALFSAFLSCDKNNNTKDGIKFEMDNWENTLVKAKAENKEPKFEDLLPRRKYLDGEFSA